MTTTITTPASNVTTLSGPASITTVLAIGQGPSGPQGIQGPMGGVAGSTTQVQYNLAGVFAGSANFTYDPATNTLTLTGGPLTLAGGAVVASAPVVNASQTWNNAAVTFTGWKLNVTDSASAAGSLLADWQVGGVSKLSVRKDGLVAWGGTSAFPALKRNAAGIDVRLADDTGYAAFAAASLAVGAGTIVLNSTGLTVGTAHSLINGSDASLSGGSFYLRATTGDSTFYGPGFIGWASGSAAAGLGNQAVTRLYRDADHVIAQRNGANAQAFRIYNTYTDASNHERGGIRWSGGVLQVFTEAAGTGAPRTLAFLPYGAGTEQWFGAAGSYVIKVAGTSLDAYTGGAIDIGAGVRFRSGYFGTSVVTAGLSTGTVTKTANYTSTVADDVILADAAAGNMVITLEGASGAAGRRKTIKKIDASANTVTIDGNASETIDGALTVVLSTQWAARGIQVNAGGTAWNVIATV